jgi:hypothetical protein
LTPICSGTPGKWCSPSPRNSGSPATAAHRRRRPTGHSPGPPWRAEHRCASGVPLGCPVVGPARRCRCPSPHGRRRPTVRRASPDSPRLPHTLASVAAVAQRGDEPRAHLISPRPWARMVQRLAQPQHRLRRRRAGHITAHLNLPRKHQAPAHADTATRSRTGGPRPQVAAKRDSPLLAGPDLPGGHKPAGARARQLYVLAKVSRTCSPTARSKPIASQHTSVGSFFMAILPPIRLLIV